MQRKIKIAASGEEFDSVPKARKRIKRDCKPLKNAITSEDQYTVKTVEDLKELAGGNEADVLLPRRHVIGETHTASEFDRIRREWRGVAAMEEGFYSVEESGLALPVARRKLHDSFEQVMLSQGADTLPLENFHAAAHAKLVTYLVIWKEHQHHPTDNTKKHVSSRTPDIINLIDTYRNVSAGVVIRAFQDRKFYHLRPRYQGAVEKAYSKMFSLLKTRKARSAIAHLDMIKEKISRGRRLPASSQKEFTKVMVLLAKMVPAVGRILNASMTDKPDAAEVAVEVSKISTYVRSMERRRRGGRMKTALNQVNPVRERFMKEQIETLDIPGLVRVGSDHIVGLKGLGPRNAEFYNDAAAFDAALKKRAHDLTDSKTDSGPSQGIEQVPSEVGTST